MGFTSDWLNGKEWGKSTAMKNEKILVTGGAGYIGSHTVHALVDAGERVVIAARVVDDRTQHAAEVGEQVEARVAHLVDGDSAPERRIIFVPFEDVAEITDARGGKRLDGTC